MSSSLFHIMLHLLYLWIEQWKSEHRKKNGGIEAIQELKDDAILIH